MKHDWRTSCVSIVACGIAACGGSGGSAPVDPPSPPAGASVNAAPLATDDGYSVRRDGTLPVTAPGVLANDSDANGDALTARLLGNAAQGALTLRSDGSFTYTPAAGFTGTDTFTYVASDGTRESAAAAVTITVGDTPTLFTDAFSRATSASVGNGWSEVEAAGAAVVIDGTRLSFADTSDGVMRPLVSHGFARVDSGNLEWEFELDWTKTGSDDAYAVYMQLGNAARMSSSSPEAGVGVNLVWGRIGGLDEALGYRRAGTSTVLARLSGRATIRVQIDVDAHAYDVYVDGRRVETRIPLEAPVAFDTLRFFTDSLDEQAFSGRSFDSVTVKGWPSGGTSSNAAPIVADRLVRADDALPTAITLAYSDDGGPGPYTFDIVDAPRDGTLGSDDGDANVTYIPAGGFIGTDRFTFRVHDGAASSSLATVSVAVQHYPGASWETRTPAEMGLDAARLDQLAASIGGVGSIVRHGYMVKTWGDQTAKADWASTAKPVLNTLLFFAVQENRIASLEDPVKDWVFAGTGGTLRPEDESMTFAQLMNMTSGYAAIEPPGAAWDYNDFAVNLKNRLIGGVFGEPLDPHLRARLGALQLEDGALLTTRGGYGVSTTTRDFARIAWFWMNRGNWRGQQILAESFFDTYMRTQVPGTIPRTAAPDADYLNAGTAGGGMDQSEYGPGHFGASWWFNDTVGTTGLRPWPNAPLDTIQAHGHWGREMIVMIPSLNLVIATRGSWGSSVPGDPNSGVNERLRILMLAVR